MSILYPVAASADEALHAPKGFAARAREAEDAGGGAASFISEAVGPAFATREALIDAYRAAAAQPWCAVRPVAAGKVKPPVKPQNTDGRRWPEPKPVQPVFWRLSISYWRIGSSDEAPSDPARQLRRDPEARDLDARALRALARQPLRPVKPQQPPTSACSNSVRRTRRTSSCRTSRAAPNPHSSQPIKGRRFMLKPILTAFVLLFFAFTHSPSDAAVWQPSPGHVQIPIWPGPAPNLVPDPKPESAGPDGSGAFDVTRPTMTVYVPKGRNTRVAMVVFPGGGYQVLAMDLEGTEICDWLTSRGITCVLLKYRVPNSGPTLKDGHRYYPKVQTALQDAQRTLGLVRQHAAEWHVDPHKVGVIGFSAGGHLVAAVSTHFAQRTYPPVDAADTLSGRPDFAIALYPGHLWVHEDEDHATRNETDLSLRPDIRVRPDTPPTFLLQAENDEVDGVKQSIAYYVALQKAGVPTEMHLYAQGGHAFGLRPTTLPIGRWPALVEQWLHTIGVLGPQQGG